MSAPKRPDDPKTVAKAKALLALGWKVHAVAEELRVPRTHVYQWSRNRVRPNQSLIDGIRILVHLEAP